MGLETKNTWVDASEADVLNMALFGMTAKEWREANKDKTGNMRDYANIAQLICLSNLENLNAMFISEGETQSERLRKLNHIAIDQMRIVADHSGVRKFVREVDYLAPEFMRHQFPRVTHARRNFVRQTTHFAGRLHV